MGLIIVPGLAEVAEVEFAQRHPDRFCTQLAADMVTALAIASGEHLGKLRVDINVQVGTMPTNVPRPITVSFSGQITAPGCIGIEKIIGESTISLIRKLGLANYRDFSELPKIDIRKITPQSAILNNTTTENRFADTCVAVGHYIASPFGIDGTFPGLVIGQKIDREVAGVARETECLRPDGKVHVTIRYNERGFKVEEVYLSVAHKEGALDEVRTLLLDRLASINDLVGAQIKINPGGDFSVYSFHADSGVSKAKDGVIITGGLHTIGTDAVWGKCAFKASSIALPYAFALSKAVCDLTGAKYASVQVYTQYGQENALIQLVEIDAAYQGQRETINGALSRLPADRDTIRDLLGMPVTVESYTAFNDVSGFHKPGKPWKANNNRLKGLLEEKGLVAKELFLSTYL